MTPVGLPLGVVPLELGLDKPLGTEEGVFWSARGVLCCWPWLTGSCPCFGGCGAILDGIKFEGGFGATRLGTSVP